MNNRSRSGKMFRNSLWCAVPLLLYILLSSIASVVVSAGYYIMNGSEIMSQITSAGSAESAMDMVYTILAKDYTKIAYASQLLGYLFQIPVFIWLMIRDEKRVFLRNPNYKKAPKIPKVYYLLPIVAGAAACIAGSNLITMSGLAEQSTSYQEVEQYLYSASVGVQLLVVGVLAPVTEELLFRGLVYKRFKSLSPVPLAMFWSALIFAMLHGNIVQGIYAFILGFMLCFCHYRYGTILAPILFHMSANLFSVVASFLETNYSSVGQFFGSTFLCFGLIVGCLYLVELKVRPLWEE